jgi:hypothetical protein
MTENHNQHDVEAKQAILDNIEKYGCHLAMLEADNYLPAFVYTIGLFKKFGHPELICFGLKLEVMASILNEACDLIKNDGTFTTNKLYSDFLEGYNIKFLAVDKEYYQNYVGTLVGFTIDPLIFHCYNLFGPTSNIISPGTKTSVPTGNLNNHCLTETPILNFMKNETWVFIQQVWHYMAIQFYMCITMKMVTGNFTPAWSPI